MAKAKKEVFKTGTKTFGPPTWWRNPSTVTDPAIPAGLSARNPCRVTKQKLADSCTTQLVFVGTEDARFMKVAPGSYIRYCTKPGKAGTLIPVDGPSESVAVAKSFCACVKGGGSGESCADTAGKNTAVGRASGVAGLKLPKVSGKVALIGVAALAAAWLWRK